jgi:hypothetical protein
MADGTTETRQDEASGTTDGAAKVAERVLRFDRSPIGATREGPSGGLIVSGNIRRTGVLDYKLPDGSTRKELCHPDEVFHTDSRESFAGAPITEGHPGKVHPGNWSDHAVGHMQGKPQREGSFLAGDLHIQDGDTIDKIKSGKLKEISCGYDCSLDMTPGVYNGEAYDAIQRNVRGNHVALGPRGWGRAGPEVSLHTDGGVSYVVEEEATSVATAETVASARTDAPNTAPTFPAMDEATKAALEKAAADLKLANEQIAKLTQDAADLAATKAKLAEAEAEKRLLETQAARADGTAAKAAEKAREDARVDEKVSLIETARKVFASKEDPTGSKWRADGKDADAIRVEILKHIEPDFVLTNTDGTSLEGGALLAVYRNALVHHEKVQAARHGAAAAAGGERIDAMKKNSGEGEGGDDDEDTCDAMKDRDDMIKAQAGRFIPASARDPRRANGMRDGAGKTVS